MEKAIELNIQGIKCDNKDCDYKKEDVKAEDYEKWLNKPCPKCGENLLTQEDLESARLLMKITDAANNIFPKSSKHEKRASMSVEFDGTGNVAFKIKE